LLYIAFVYRVLFVFVLCRSVPPTVTFSNIAFTPFVLTYN
jgi:hypothetical protein